jgi:hypothetical protein
MKKPTVLLYACSAILSFGASLILDLDDPRPPRELVRRAELREPPALSRRMTSVRK